MGRAFELGKAISLAVNSGNISQRTVAAWLVVDSLHDAEPCVDAVRVVGEMRILSLFC